MGATKVKSAHHGAIFRSEHRTLGVAEHAARGRGGETKPSARPSSLGGGWRLHKRHGKEKLMCFNVQRAEAGAGARTTGEGCRTRGVHPFKQTRSPAGLRTTYSATKRIYEPDPRFEFRYDTIEEALTNAKKPEGYLGKLSEKF